jgi:SNF2 family DNA or RNA helicase
MPKICRFQFDRESWDTCFRSWEKRDIVSRQSKNPEASDGSAMARLFGKDYHEHSNTWYFNQAIIPLQEGDLLYWKSLDESDRIRLRFFPAPEKSHQFCDHINIVYDPKEEKIVSHKCSDCGDDDACRHYLSLLYYTYHHLKTDILKENIIETYQGNLLVGNEKWQRLSQEAQIEVEGIYNPETDKIRFYFNQYQPLDVRLLCLVCAGKPVEDENPKQTEEIIANLNAFTEAERHFFATLNVKRASSGSKGLYLSVNKKDFAFLLPIIRELKGKFIVKETREELKFIEQDFQLALRIEHVSGVNYILRPVLVDELSAWFNGQPVWLFFRNEIRTVRLPFKPKLVNALFRGQFSLQKNDLVYFRTIVWKQLNRHNIYLDFDEKIALPPFYDNPPSVHFFMHRLDEDILLEGTLRYNPEVQIPISAVRFQSPLVSYEMNGTKCWFQIPSQVFEQVNAFLRKLPNPQYDRLEQYSQLVFRGGENLEILKKAVYELSEENWDIEIDETLKREFIYKVPLQAQITARLSDEINWFSYDINYRYKDFSFSHEELRKFFKSKQQFLQTQDGRLVFLTQREVFDEMESLLKKSDFDKDKVYRARVNILPYYWRLREENPALQLYGDEYLEQMFRALLTRHADKEEKLPPYLNTVLRSYQKAGYQWLRMLMKYKLHGILADEMGLGKTIQALSVLAETPEGSVSLVICPKTLLYNWAAEIEKFHTNIPYQIYEGSKPERVKLLQNPNVRLFIISYTLVLNDIAELGKMNFKWIVLDEAQHIKNVAAQRTGAIKKLKAEHRLALSGTPIENDMTELWSILDFLMPGYLGSLGKFKQEYVSELPQPEIRARLNRLAAPFILRRIKKDVLLELPDKQEQVSWCKLNPVQEKLYLQILEAVRQSLFPSGVKDASQINYIHVLSALTKLRQVCNHPALVNPDIRNDMEISAKTEQLMELVEEAIESGHKILVFSQFVEMLKLIRGYFDRQNITYEYMDGKTRDRQKHVDRFNDDPKVKVFLISLKTGGTGLNLTSADTVILVDPWWNPMIENQAIDRTHRIGQTRKVQVFRLITKGTVEEKIISLQQNKLELFQNIIDEGQSVIKLMDSQTLKDLFFYEA